MFIKDISCISYLHIHYVKVKSLYNKINIDHFNKGNMNAYTTYIKQELPHINTLIEESIAELPSLVRPIAKHILLSRGKRLRPILVILLATLFGYKQQDIYQLAISVEILHAATLLHDDVLDNALLRRNQNTAHTLFGTVPTILAGDALLAKGNWLVAVYGNQQCMLAMSQALFHTAQGEILEISNQGKVWEDNSTYLKIITGKTAWIIQAACVVGALKAGVHPQQLDIVASFGRNLGIAFQLIDDVLDFLPSKVTGKPEGGDIREGKFTPPLLYYMKQLPIEEKKDFIEKFKTQNFSNEDILKITETVRNNAFDQQTRNIAERYSQNALENLALLTDIPNPEYKIILTECLHYISTRNI